MARLARVIVPGVPHHVTQRGNRRQATFFNDADYAAYLELMAEWCVRLREAALQLLRRGLRQAAVEVVVEAEGADVRCRFVAKAG